MIGVLLWGDTCRRQDKDMVFILNTCGQHPHVERNDILSVVSEAKRKRRANPTGSGELAPQHENIAVEMMRRSARGEQSPTVIVLVKRKTNSTFFDSGTVGEPLCIVAQS